MTTKKEDEHKSEEALAKDKIANQTKEANAKEELGEDMPGVASPTDTDDLDEALNAGQAGETVMTGEKNPENEIEPPRPLDPAIEDVHGNKVAIRKVWDLNFNNSQNNIEGLGHAFASIGVNFTAAATHDNEDKELFNYALAYKTDDVDEREPLYKGGLAKNATVDDVYRVFEDFCLKEKPVYLGQFGAHATKND